MAKRSEFVEYLLDELAPLGHLRAKAMFGGFGLYCDDLFFALVADEILYLKVDDLNRPRFMAEQLTPFAMKDGGHAHLRPLPKYRMYRLADYD